MIDVVKVLSVKRYKCGYEVRREIWRTPDCPDIEMLSAYTPNGDYIGVPRSARYLIVKRGIAPQKLTPESITCSIGYSTKDGKWYGWSHRAIYGFKVGSVCKKESSHYRSKKDGGKGEWVAKTTADAKQMAIDFAASVS